MGNRTSTATIAPATTITPTITPTLSETTTMIIEITANANLSYGEPDGTDNGWTLTFDVKLSKVICFRFNMFEPSTEKLSSWQSLAAGNKIDLHNNMGTISGDGIDITFEISQANGDVDATYVIPYKYIGIGLTNALDTAVAAGFSFRPE